MSNEQKEGFNQGEASGESEFVRVRVRRRAGNRTRHNDNLALQTLEVLVIDEDFRHLGECMCVCWCGNLELLILRSVKRRRGRKVSVVSWEIRQCCDKSVVYGDRQSLHVLLYKRECIFGGGGRNETNVVPKSTQENGLVYLICHLAYVYLHE